LSSRRADCTSKTGSAQSKTRPDTSEVGPHERAVLKQFTQYMEDEPVLVEMALGAARILDNPERATLHPPTLRQLSDIREKLTGGRKTKSKGRLAAIVAMSGNSNRVTG
jgi:hypothetical protein